MSQPSTQQQFNRAAALSMFWLFQMSSCGIKSCKFSVIKFKKAKEV